LSFVHNFAHIAQHINPSAIQGLRDAIDAPGEANTVAMHPRISFHVQQTALNFQVAYNTTKTADTRVRLNVLDHLVQVLVDLQPVITG
jgi:hypothetical protein